MEKPLCKLCGKKHWPSVAHAFGGPGNVGQRSVEMSKSAGSVEDVHGTDVSALAGTVDDPATSEPRGSFDRVAYQREYMRKRRAASREARQEEK